MAFTTLGLSGTPARPYGAFAPKEENAGEEYLSLFKHLLPKAKAWRLTENKYLRRFFQGLSNGLVPFTKNYYDDIWNDIFPETTQQLDLWEEQWGLADLIAPVTEQERRNRLDGTWKALGGQSPSYIQTILQANGFDVYVHEWWVPDAFPLYAFYCGDELAQCGEPGVECVNAIPTVRDPFDVLAPDNLTPVVGKGYPLVNKITEITSEVIVLCGESLIQCGEEDAECNNQSPFEYNIKQYNVTIDPLTWPYYLYIGAETFGDLADIPSDRRNEFENLCLKICPTQLWLGMLINYI